MQALVMGSPKMASPPESVLTDVAEQHLGACAFLFVFAARWLAVSDFGGTNTHFWLFCV